MIPDLIPQAKMDTGQCKNSPICCFRLHQQLAACLYCFLLVLGKVCAAPMPQSCSPPNYSCKLDFYCKESIAQCVPCTTLSPNDCQPPTPNWIPCYYNHDTACIACVSPDQFKNETDGQCHYCQHCDSGDLEVSPCNPFKDRVCSSLKNSTTTDPAPTSNSTTPNLSSSVTKGPKTSTQQSYTVTNTTKTWISQNLSSQIIFQSSGIQTLSPTLTTTIHMDRSSLEPVIFYSMTGFIVLTMCFLIMICISKFRRKTGSFPPPSAEMQNREMAPQGHVPSSGKGDAIDFPAPSAEMQVFPYLSAKMLEKEKAPQRHVPPTLTDHEQADLSSCNSTHNRWQETEV